MMRTLDAAGKTIPEFTLCSLCKRKLGMRPDYTMNGYVICAGCYRRVFWLRCLSDMIGELVPPEIQAILDGIREMVTRKEEPQ